MDLHVLITMNFSVEITTPMTLIHSRFAAYVVVEDNSVFQAQTTWTIVELTSGKSIQTLQIRLD